MRIGKVKIEVVVDYYRSGNQLMNFKPQVKGFKGFTVVLGVMNQLFYQSSGALN